jgi:hypothetical protein
MANGWLEPHTRIPLAGIIAMVVIVAVVAIFVKTQLSPLFPESEITIQQESDSNIAGSASASFYGDREIPLARVGYLQGTVTDRSGTATYRVDTAARMLYLQRGTTEEIVLRQEGDLLIASTEQDGVPTNYVVEPVRERLAISKPGTSSLVLQVALRETVTYRGAFSLRGRECFIDALTAEDAALIHCDGTDRVELERADDALTGVWEERGKEHPMRVDLNERIATISDVY